MAGAYGSMGSLARACRASGSRYALGPYNAVDPTPLNIPSCSCFVPRSLGARAHNYAVYVCQHVYTCIRVANCRYTAFISCTTGKVVPIASRSREAASAARHLHTLQTHTIPPVRCQPPRYSKRVASEKNTRTLCSQTCLNMPRSEKVGASRQGDVQAASSREGGETPYLQAIFAHQKAAFRV